MTETKPIGVFDSGYGGLTVLKEMVKTLPQYDYLYLGDNARAPYGPRSLIRYTSIPSMRTVVFAQGCELVILACTQHLQSLKNHPTKRPAFDAPG